MLRKTAIMRAVNGLGAIPAGNLNAEDHKNSVAHPVNERGVRSMTQFEEPTTALYDGVITWQYLLHDKVNIEKMPLPEKEYYQVKTKREWDITTQEHNELKARRLFVHFWWLAALNVFVFFIMTKEKKYSGKSDISSDGVWMGMPKNHPEKY